MTNKNLTEIEQTFEGLPEECFGVLASTEELILIKRGVRGYFPQRPENAQWSADNVDLVNEQRGITKGQRMAMEKGSMFGWNTPASNPANYDEDGNWLR